MFIARLAENAPLYFLIVARIFAFLAVVPIYSSGAMPTLVRIVLAATTAVVLFPILEPYPLPTDGLGYILIMTGEILIGLIGGFFVYILFSIFLLVGGFLSLPMGFSASQVFDPLGEIEIPLVGQLFNTIAIYIFIVSDGLRQVFFVSIINSVNSLRAIDLALYRGDALEFLLTGFFKLFVYSLTLALPFLAVLFLTSLSMGLLTKAAPQMNLLILGFPISISISYVLLFLFAGTLMAMFANIMSWIVDQLGVFYQIYAN